MSKTDIAFCAALSLVVAGVALVYYPAALIVAGTLLCGLTVAYDRAADHSGDK